MLGVKMYHLKKIMKSFSRTIVTLCLVVTATQAFTIDSLFEPIMRPFQFLPDYYLRFDMSGFLNRRDEFFRRQYLAEPHPDLDFCLISYKNIVASVWQVDFLFNLGKAPGDNVFTVLGVAFGINPTIEVRLPRVTLAGGIAHRCFHNIDRTEFPVAYYNKFFVSGGSPNYRLNSFWQTLEDDSTFNRCNRWGWFFSTGLYLKEFFGLVEPNVVTMYDPSIWDMSSMARYAFYRRTSWMFAVRGETTLGLFQPKEGYQVSSGGSVFWKQALGLEAFFTRGSRGACFYALLHLDDLPVAEIQPEFTLGHARFSKNGLVQFGVTFFN
jgi:hypothetical protein